MNPINEGDIKAKYPPEIALRLINTAKIIDELSSDNNNASFAIRIDHYYYITKDINKENFIILGNKKFDKPRTKYETLAYVDMEKVRSYLRESKINSKTGKHEEGNIEEGGTEKDAEIMILENIKLMNNSAVDLDCLLELLNIQQVPTDKAIFSLWTKYPINVKKNLFTLSLKRKESYLAIQFFINEKTNKPDMVFAGGPGISSLPYPPKPVNDNNVSSS
jgi:hypothetical protein